MSFLTGLTALWKIISSAIAVVSAIAIWIMRVIRDNEQKKQKDKLKSIVDKAKDAKTIEGKADAACEMEKMLNPTSDCVLPNGRESM